MAKVKITVKRAHEGRVTRSFVAIDQRILPFENSDEIKILVEANRLYPVAVFCEGNIPASVTLSIDKPGPEPFVPLKAELEFEGTVQPGYGDFTVFVP